MDVSTIDAEEVRDAPAATYSPADEAKTAPRTFLVDGHVHFYDCFDDRVFLDAADDNFRAAAAQLGLGADSTACLMFTESSGDHHYRRFRSMASAGSGMPWSFRETQEDCSLVASKDGSERLVLIAGRQIVTAEGLEVLALGCDREFADGQSLPQAVDAVLETGAVAAVPWGFGKWWLRRGELLGRYLRGGGSTKVFLGDNANRLQWAMPPALFRWGAAHGVAVLPGTDPLPFPTEATNVGSYGFVLNGAGDRDRPAASIVSLLKAGSGQPPVYGRRESVVSFCLNQVRMQIWKRLK